VIDLVVGIIGAFIGSWLLPRLGIQLGVGLIAAILDATIGAILLLLVVRALGAAVVIRVRENQRVIGAYVDDRVDLVRARARADRK
jgi:uncharacterized membrane protein YeaQ/YmgE (transglycosylase-associated protein family)